MSRERRQAPRVSERIALAITDAAVALQTETNNLSTSGLYCTLDRFIAPMTKLELDLELPQGKSPVRIRCSGVVVRVEPIADQADRPRYNVAVFFTDLSDRHRAEISQFIRHRLSA